MFIEISIYHFIYYLSSNIYLSFYTTMVPEQLKQRCSYYVGNSLDAALLDISRSSIEESKNFLKQLRLPLQDKETREILMIEIVTIA